MTEKVVSLDGGPVRGSVSAPNPHAVAALEEMLESARTGNLRGFVMVGMMQDRICPYLMVGEIGGFTMAGALSAAMYELNVMNTEPVEED